ncbi:MAG: hypothetical protein SGARI_006850 [Bacillariaceae sp.]
MKFCLASIAAVASLSVSSGFTVRQSTAPARSSVVLEASRNAAKKISRAQWAEGRGITGGAAVAEAGAEAGMMKNADGLDFVRLVSPGGAAAEVYLFGGVVTSYKDAEGTEFIAVRPDAKMDGSKPISGGLSHCWPQRHEDGRVDLV